MGSTQYWNFPAEKNGTNGDILVKYDHGNFYYYARRLGDWVEDNTMMKEIYINGNCRSITEDEAMEMIE
jgi:hypothetical protein